jgi:hypothetical protein
MQDIKMKNEFFQVNRSVPVEAPSQPSTSDSKNQESDNDKLYSCEAVAPTTSLHSSKSLQLAIDTSNQRPKNGDVATASPSSPHLPPGRAEAPSSPASAEYWLSRAPIADEIVITDVTVNLMTVTIRECKKKDGFFKGKEDGTEATTIGN